MLTKAFVLTTFVLGLTAQSISFGGYKKTKHVLDNDYIHMDLTYDHEFEWGTYYIATDEGGYHTESYGPYS